MTDLWRAVRFVLGLGFRTDRRRLLIASVLMAIGYVATPFIGVLLGAFVTAALEQRITAALVLGLATAALLVFELTMAHFAHLYYFELGDLQQLELTDELAGVAHGSADLGRLDRSSFAETLTLARENVGRLRMALESTLQLGATLLQLLVTAVLLVTVDPWLLLLPLAAVPPVVIGQRAQRLLDDARRATASDVQLSRHLVSVATTGGSAKEVRMFGARDAVTQRQQAAWAAVVNRIWSAQRRGAVLKGVGQAWFACAYGLALLLVVRRALAGEAGVGEVVLVIALAVQVSLQVAGALTLLGVLQGVGRTVEQIESLRSGDAPRSDPDPATVVRALPDRIVEGITMEHVSFAYPGTDRLVLRDVTLFLPAGSTVAFVGENGAGKSSLVKLLCGLYRPTSGRILIDGVDLQDMEPARWQEKIAALFQDFFRFQFVLRESVGTGHLPRLDDADAVRAALHSAEGRRIADLHPDGLETLLGHRYGNGVELSGGQWQTIGLARALMRPEALLMVLDEPAAALDATAEHALFERFTDTSARASRSIGAVTCFVSHRFSTVRGADQIVVLRNGEVHELGDHAALLRCNGTYAELFALQADAYAP
jgi:ATP-binding cassette subfamily B protein